MPKTKSSRSKLLKYLLVFGLFLGVTSRIVYLKMVQPSGINEVSSGWVATKSDLMAGITAEEQARLSAGKPGVKLANGCVSQQVQCFAAPCPPVWSCPPGVTPPPVESRMCTQEAGSCMTTSGQCSTYTDGCIKAKICANPYQKCEMTRPTPPTTSPQPCVTMPSCPAGKVCPMAALQRDQVYCSPKPTSTTIPANCTSWFDGCNTCSVENGVVKACTKIACKDSTKPPSCLAYTVPAPSLPPSCSCPPGATCKLSAECNRPSSSPSPVLMGLGSFSATKACGANSFASVTYSCQKDKSLITLSNGDCIDMYSALKKAISYCGTVVSGVNTK